MEGKSAKKNKNLEWILGKVPFVEGDPMAKMPFIMNGEKGDWEREHPPLPF